MPDFVKAASRAADRSDSDAPLAFTLARTITEYPFLTLGRNCLTASLSSLLTRLRETDPPSFLLTEKPILVPSALPGSTYTTMRSVAQDLPFEYTLPKSDLRFSRDANGSIASVRLSSASMTDVRELTSRTIECHRLAGLSAQLPATLAASRLEDPAAALGRHPRHETVLAFPGTTLRLVCAFHLSSFTPWLKVELYHAPDSHYKLIAARGCVPDLRNEGISITKARNHENAE